MFEPNLEELASINRKAQQKMLMIYTFVGIPLLLLFGVVHIVSEIYFLGLAEIGIAFIGIVNILLLRLHKNQTITSLIVVLLIYVLYIFLAHTGGFHGTGVYWIFIYPLFVITLLTSVQSVFFITALFGALIVMFILNATHDNSIGFYTTVELRQLILSLGVYTTMLYIFQQMHRYTQDLLKEKMESLSYLNQDIQRQKDKNQVDLEKLNSTVSELENVRLATLNILEDVDEERKLSLSNAEELKKFKMAVDASSDHIVITDTQGVILYANPAVKIVTGFEPKSLIGMKAGTSKNWGGEMDKPFYEKMWKRILVERKPFSGQLRNKRKNGETYIAQTTISPMLNDDGDVVFFIGVERDVTREHQIDKMKSEFISLASHQLRTPLSAMKWFLEMLLDGDGGKLNKDQKNFVVKINESNERMIALVNSLLNVSRIETGRLKIDVEETSLKELIMDVVEMMTPRAKKKQQKILVKANKIPKIKLDPKLMRQVITNLVSNAVKYTDKKGKIEIAVVVKGSKILMTFKDNGFGIPQSDQKKVFDKFFRAKNIISVETDGNGLGLYLVQEIIKAFKGKIWFESQENKGTTFFIELPKKGVSGRQGDIQLLD